MNIRYQIHIQCRKNIATFRNNLSVSRKIFNNMNYVNLKPHTKSEYILVAYRQEIKSYRISHTQWQLLNKKQQWIYFCVSNAELLCESLFKNNEIGESTVGWKCLEIPSSWILWLFCHSGSHIKMHLRKFCSQMPLELLFGWFDLKDCHIKMHRIVESFIVNVNVVRTSSQVARAAIERCDRQRKMVK